MCYGPYDNDTMLRDISARTKGVRAPKLGLAPMFGVLAKLTARVFRRGDKPKLAVRPWQRSRRA